MGKQRQTTNSTPTIGPCSLEDIKKSIDDLSTGMKQKDKKIENLIQKVSELEQTIKRKDKRIEELENRIEDLEAVTNESKRFSLKNNIIIRGLAITKPPRTFSEVARQPEPLTALSEETMEAVRLPGSTMESEQGQGAFSRSSQSQPPRDSNYKTFTNVRDQLLAYFDEHVGIKLDTQDIVAAHELRAGQKDSTPPLVVRFAFTSIKQDLIENYRHRRIFKNKIYFNDQLTVLNGKISFQARTLKKNDKIHSTWTRLGKVFIKDTQNSRPVWIQKLKDLPSM